MSSCNVGLVAWYFLDSPLEKVVRVHIGLQDAITATEDAGTEFLDALVDIGRSGKRGHFP